MTDTVTEDWYVLEWKDNAGREDSMAGPASALKAQKDVLDKNEIEYKYDKIGSATTKAAPKKKTATKKVADKDLEVR